MLYLLKCNIVIQTTWKILHTPLSEEEKEKKETRGVRFTLRLEQKENCHTFPST